MDQPVHLLIQADDNRGEKEKVVEVKVGGFEAEEGGTDDMIDGMEREMH